MPTDPTLISRVRIVPQAYPMLVRIDMTRMVTTAQPPPQARDEVNTTMMQPQPWIR